MSTKNAGSILFFLEAHKEDILEKGKSIVISLSDGYCTIEKGLDDSPFMIKIDELEPGLSIEIDEYLPVTIGEFLGVNL